MWRFTRNNGITEGFHARMEVLQRQAYGFGNCTERVLEGYGNVFLMLRASACPHE